MKTTHTPFKGYDRVSWNVLSVNDKVKFCTHSSWHPVHPHQRGVVEAIDVNGKYPSITVLKGTGDLERFKLHELKLMYWWREIPKPSEV